ncbi:hypothetical protein Tco_1376129 [Tanacetum coccineum]
MIAMFLHAKSAITVQIHDECVLEYLSRLILVPLQQNKMQSIRTTKRYMPVEKSSASKKPERQIPTGHRFSNKKTTTVLEKTRTPRSCLRWQPTGRILKTVCLRWIPTGKLLNSCTGKVDSEPTHGSIVDIPHIQACKQTLGLSAAVQGLGSSLSNGLSIENTLQGPNSRPQHMNRQVQSLVPKVVPLAVKKATSRTDNKVVRLEINPMIQPEPEDLPKDNPKLEIAVLRKMTLIGPSDAMHNPSQHSVSLNRNLSHLSWRYIRYLLTSHSEIIDNEYGGSSQAVLRVLRNILLIVCAEHPSDTNVFSQMKMEILLEPAFNQALVGDLRDSL